MYHLNETWSVEALHFNFYTNIESGFSKSLLKNANLEVERIEPVLSLGTAIQWAPFQGKSATADSIYHFEGYFLAGGGFTKFEVALPRWLWADWECGCSSTVDRLSSLNFGITMISKRTPVIA